LSGFGTLSLSAQNLVQAYRGPKFKRLRFILARSSKGLGEAGFRLFDISVPRSASAFGALEEKFALKPMKFGLPSALFVLAHEFQSFVDGTQALVSFSHTKTRFRELGR
jgi:hypothetical protein